MPVAPVLPVEQITEKVPFSECWRDALLPYLGTRLVLVVVGLFATYYLMPIIINRPPLVSGTTYIGFPEALWSMWTRFDSGFYLNIAAHGYWPASTLHMRSDWAFYPLYPLLISGLGRLFGGSSVAFNLAGLLISNVAGCIAIGYLYWLVRREFSKEVAVRTVLYQALFPMSLYLSAVYAESLFLMLAIACIYYARKQSWWLACLCGGLAALTHSQGVLLVIPVVWQYLHATSEHYAPLPEQLPRKLLEYVDLRVNLFLQGLWRAAGIFRNWLTILAFALIPAGLFTFMVYGKINTGDFLATFHNSDWGWGRKLSPPWHLLISSLQNPASAAPMDWNFWIFNIIASLAFLCVVAWVFRRLPFIYGLYAALMVVLPLSTNMLNSIGRYYLVIFPAFILLALLSRGDKPHWHNFILVSFAALQAVFMVFFVIGAPMMA